MPELPEVETVIQSLKQSLMGATITDISLTVPSLLEPQSLPLAQLVGNSFTAFERRGKYLLFGFTSGLWLVVHLRMEGKFHVFPISQAPNPTKHTHCIITTQQVLVHYLDVRKFSRFALTKDLEAYLETKHLGLEPFDDKLNGKYLFDCYKRRATAIKTVLLNQAIIAGIGNIYADEILYAARIHPHQSAQTLSLRECGKIVTQTQAVLTRAISQGGTTIRSYTSSFDVSGRFQIELHAYGRKGQPCHRCGHMMVGQKLNGRSTVWCPQCQRMKI